MSQAPKTPSSMEILDKLLDGVSSVNGYLISIDLRSISSCRRLVDRSRKYVSELLNGVLTAIEFQKEFSEIDFFYIVNLRMNLVEWLNNLMDILVRLSKCLESHGYRDSLDLANKSIDVVNNMLKVLQNA